MLVSGKSPKFSRRKTASPAAIYSLWLLPHCWGNAPLLPNWEGNRGHRSLRTLNGKVATGLFPIREFFVLLLALAAFLS